MKERTVLTLSDKQLKKLFNYKKISPCSCVIDGKEYFCMQKTLDSPCMKKKKSDLGELIDKMGETFNEFKDKVILERERRLRELADT